MDRACTTHESEEECKENFGVKARLKETTKKN
jgi:hypothetical protein